MSEDKDLLKTIFNEAIHALSHGQAWSTADRIGVLVEGLQDIVKLCDRNLEQLPVLWEIAKAVADTDSTYETCMGDTECVFCNGQKEITGTYDADTYETSFVHDDDCAVMKARELLTKEQPKP